MRYGSTMFSRGLGLGSERARVAIVGTSLGGWLALDYCQQKAGGSFARWH